MEDTFDTRLRTGQYFGDIFICGSPRQESLAELNKNATDY